MPSLWSDPMNGWSQDELLGQAFIDHAVTVARITGRDWREIAGVPVWKATETEFRSAVGAALDEVARFPAWQRRELIDHAVKSCRAPGGWFWPPHLDPPAPFA